MIRGTTLIDLLKQIRSFTDNAGLRPGLLPVKGSPGRLWSELRLPPSPGGSQSVALTVPVRALQRTFLRHCLSNDDYTSETAHPENSVTEKLRSLFMRLNRGFILESFVLILTVSWVINLCNML